MLSDEMIQLLTAFVDGELNERQRKAVARLLGESSEARELLKQLQENAHRLKKLPRHKVEPSLAEPVLQAIAVQKAQPAPTTPARRKQGWMPYVVATMAASVLIAVIGLIVWQSMNPHSNVNNIAKNEEKKEEPKQSPTPNPVQPQKAPAPVPPAPTPQAKPKPVNPLLARITEGMYRNAALPIVPYQASFADLKKDGKAINLFVAELRDTKSVQLDVTVKKNSEALGRLNNVLKNQGITLVGDSVAKKAADKKNVEFSIYAENLTLDEVTALVNELGSDYVMGLGTTEKKMATPFNKATLNPLEADAKQKIAKVLGDTPAKNEGKERMVIVLPGNASAPTAAEVNQFVNQRRVPQPGTIQILIKIRQE